MNIHKILTAMMITSCALTSSAWAEEKTDAPSADEPVLETEDGLPYHLRDVVLGDADAPVTVYEYASFTCIHCDNFHTNVFPLMQEKYINTGKIKLVYREVFFDGPALLATSLARCVPEEQYFNMAKALFDTDETWLRSQENMDGVVGELTKLGILAGLDKESIQRCLSDRTKQEEMLTRSQGLMDEDKITGTPTLIIDDKKVDDWQWDNLDKLLEKATED